MTIVLIEHRPTGVVVRVYYTAWIALDALMETSFPAVLNYTGNEILVE
jgi:hypothetical protein